MYNLNDRSTELQHLKSDRIGLLRYNNPKAGYVFEAEDRKSQKKVALKRIEKVGNQLSREY